MKKPLYQLNEHVEFKTIDKNREVVVDGRIVVVDKFGTFEQHEEPSYDILVDNWPTCDFPTIFKHIRQSEIIGSMEDSIQ